MEVLKKSEYDIIVEDEMQTFEPTLRALQKITDTMNDYHCLTLVGGNEECPVYFSRNELHEVIKTLAKLLDDEPHTMY